MKRSITLIILSWLSSILANAGDLSTNYQLVADQASWKWSDCSACGTFFHGESHCGYQVIIHIVPASSNTLEKRLVEVRKNEELCASFSLPYGAVFGINGNRLIYTPSERGMGGTFGVTQIDLLTGKKHWRTYISSNVDWIKVLGGGTNVPTSFSVRLEFINDEVVYIWVCEAGIRYLDIKSAETGQTVGYRLFDSVERQALTIDEFSQGDTSQSESYSAIPIEPPPEWSTDVAGPLYSMQLMNAGNGLKSSYLARMQTEPNSQEALSFTVADSDGRDRFTWRGHRWTVFRVVHHQLYYADWDPQASGGEIVAVDLEHGTEIWRTRLQALGPVANVNYSNRINIDVNSEYITTWGKETLGRYVEFKNPKTGETLAHKIFPEAPNDSNDVER